MDEIVSTIVANGVWAVLFCLLLVYELRDSRSRESRYTRTIGELTARLNALNAVKSDTEEIKSDAKDIKSNTEEIKSDAKDIKSNTEEIKTALAPRGGKSKKTKRGEATVQASEVAAVPCATL